MKRPLLYPEVEYAYILHGIKGQYQFETVEEVIKVLRFDIRKTKGFDKIAENKKEVAENLIISFINRFGLEYRDAMYPMCIQDIPEKKQFRFDYKSSNGKRYSYLCYDGTVR